MKGLPTTTMLEPTMEVGIYTPILITAQVRRP